MYSACRNINAFVPHSSTLMNKPLLPTEHIFNKCSIWIAFSLRIKKSKLIAATLILTLKQTLL